MINRPQPPVEPQAPTSAMPAPIAWFVVGLAIFTTQLLPLFLLESLGISSGSNLFAGVWVAFWVLFLVSCWFFRAREQSYLRNLTSIAGSFHEVGNAGQAVAWGVIGVSLAIGFSFGFFLLSPILSRNWANDQWEQLIRKNEEFGRTKNLTQPGGGGDKILRFFVYGFLALFLLTFVLATLAIHFTK